MTRRGLFERMFAAAATVYDQREAASVAYMLLEELAGLSRLDIAAGPDIPSSWTPVLERAAKQVADGRPAQYIVGRAWFREMWFAVGEGVLIPRPETEELVQWIIDDVAEGLKFVVEGASRILDIGTGSGAIAVALAKELAGSDVWAMDISTEALGYARRNAGNNEVQIGFILGDILDGDDCFEKSRFDIIVSNPPYIPESESGRMHINVTEYEPRQALFVPDGDPLVFYGAIAAKAGKWLAPGGLLYFEIHETAGDDLPALMEENGFSDVMVREDINGKKRMLRCRKNG